MALTSASIDSSSLHLLDESPQRGEQDQPSGDEGAVRLSDAPTEEILQTLCASRTDLAKLVKRVNGRHLRIVAVSPKAIARWQMEAQGAWERVREWLMKRGVDVVYR